MIEKCVSVIVPVYNEELYLEDCLKSITKQTYKNIQLVIVDDGSKESVGCKCDEFAQSDTRILVIHKQNEGLSAARVTGVKNATGEYIMFVDDDDVLPLDAIEILVSNIKDADICTGRSVDLEDLTTYRSTDEKFDCKYLSGIDVCEWMAVDKEKKITTPLWGKIYTREYLDSINIEKYKSICPTIFFEDVLMTPMVYAQAKKVAVVDRVIYIHRELATSISHERKLSNYYFEQIDSGNILLEFCKAKNIPKMFEFELEIYYRVILRIWCLIDKANLSAVDETEIRNKIVKYYKKYFKDLWRSNQSIFKKFLYFLFCINKNIWGKLVYKVYFVRNK